MCCHETRLTQLPWLKRQSTKQHSPQRLLFAAPRRSCTASWWLWKSHSRYLWRHIIILGKKYMGVWMWGLILIRMMILRLQVRFMMYINRNTTYSHAMILGKSENPRRMKWVISVIFLPHLIGLLFLKPETRECIADSGEVIALQFLKVPFFFFLQRALETRGNVSLSWREDFLSPAHSWSGMENYPTLGSLHPYFQFPESVSESLMIFFLYVSILKLCL